MRPLVPMLLAATLLGAVAPLPAEALQAASHWWEWAAPYLAGGTSIRTSRGTVITIPDRRKDWERDRRDRDRRDRERDRRRFDDRYDRGPAFCRSGEGHPVFGYRWCVERGYGLPGRVEHRRAPAWRRGDWGKVIIIYPRHYRAGTVVTHAELIDILGLVSFRRFESYARGLAPGTRLAGRWYQPPGFSARVLQIHAGGVPIAELTDLDHDGVVDILLLNGR